MPGQQPSIVWFRTDLRLADQPALHAAVRDGAPLLCVYIHAPEEHGDWAPGAASRWWLHHSLHALNERLRALDQTLILRRGPSLAVLRELIATCGATRVYVNHVYEPALVQRDRAIAAQLQRDGVQWIASHGALWTDPTHLATQSGMPYRVFTPFWRALQKTRLPDAPPPAPRSVPPAPATVTSLPLDALNLLPRSAWDAGLRASWQPGEQAAHDRLAHFLETSLRDYPVQRDVPDRDGTSRLSPHLHFGEISARQIAHAVRTHAAHDAAPGAVEASEHLVRELAWREFAYYVLHHFPHTPEAPLDARFEMFPWARDGGDTLRRWQQGRTGIPIVDAGLRELWHTGWMHNRVRMIVASYLTKHLLLHWSLGARWFWDTLVDADLACNTFNWQWCAGCGADAAPYFRVFNPVTQGEKFDPHGAYVRRWVPELRGMSTDFIHQPWNAPVGALREAGVTIDAALITPEAGRQRALQAYRLWRAH